MEVKIYFSIISTDGFDIGIEARSTITGNYIPADFYHDIEDNRECMVDEITFTNDDGEDFEPSSKLINIVYEHVDDFVMQIYNDALACHNDNDIYISDFKSDHDYATLMY